MTTEIERLRKMRSTRKGVLTVNQELFAMRAGAAHKLAGLTETTPGGHVVQYHERDAFAFETIAHELKQILDGADIEARQLAHLRMKRDAKAVGDTDAVFISDATARELAKISARLERCVE